MKASLIFLLLFGFSIRAIAIEEFEESNSRESLLTIRDPFKMPKIVVDTVRPKTELEFFFSTIVQISLFQHPQH